jgi:uncharacterized iron-regulated membrane protein
MKKNKKSRALVISENIGSIIAILLGLAIALGLVWFIVWIIKSIAGM